MAKVIPFKLNKSLSAGSVENGLSVTHLNMVVKVVGNADHIPRMYVYHDQQPVLPEMLSFCDLDPLCRSILITLGLILPGKYKQDAMNMREYFSLAPNEEQSLGRVALIPKQSIIDHWLYLGFMMNYIDTKGHLVSERVEAGKNISKAY